MSDTQHCDVVIAGGGMVGKGKVLLLATLPSTLRMVRTVRQPIFRKRASYLWCFVEK